MRLCSRAMYSQTIPPGMLRGFHPGSASRCDTGFGDYDFASQLHPGLTTVGVPTGKIGAASARLLIDRLNKVSKAEEVCDLGFELIVREST
ncbi:substrate-binding domain-containing protein [Burkholderia sp. A2]|uniref:substrate-binding domain-containing protein n=1 Tax=Burkholderia sp. A2 TaxID=236253 RepID=UPI000A050198